LPQQVGLRVSEREYIGDDQWLASACGLR